MFLTAQQIVEASQSEEKRQYLHDYSNDYGHWYPQRVYQPLSLIRAEQLLANVRAATLAVAQNKVNRPWELVDLTTRLDPKQAWVGIEFESGFTQKSTYDRVVNHVFDTYDNAVIDREGYGNYCPEITFAPENLSNFLNGQSCMQRLLNWMHEANARVRNWSPTAMVGTHANISTPTFRNMDEEKAARIAQCLTYSLYLIPDEDLITCFGRKPYGAANFMRAGKGKQWIEFKVFNSTADCEQFAGYVKVIELLAKVIERMSNSERDFAVKYVEGKNMVPVIWNLGDVLLGKTDRIKYVSINGEVFAFAGAGHLRYDAGNSFRKDPEEHMKSIERRKANLRAMGY